MTGLPRDMRQKSIPKNSLYFRGCSEKEQPLNVQRRLYEDFKIHCGRAADKKKTRNVISIISCLEQPDICLHILLFPKTGMVTQKLPGSGRTGTSANHR